MTDTITDDGQSNHRRGVNSEKDFEMSEEFGSSVSSQDTSSSSAPVTPVSQSSSAGESHAPSEKQERLFTQQEVNDLVGRNKREAVERFQRQQMAKLSQNQDGSSQDGHQNASYGSSDEIRRIAAEESQRLMDKSTADAQRNAQMESANRIATEFFTKLGTGKEKYQDFEKVMSDVEFQAIPHVVELANMTDNTADLMYELAKNPSKIANIQQLIAISPKLAYAEMQKLSQSIKDNESAANVKLPNSPLSQLRPSSNTGADNGVLSVKDLRAKYRV